MQSVDMKCTSIHTERSLIKTHPQGAHVLLDVCRAVCTAHTHDPRANLRPCPYSAPSKSSISPMCAKSSKPGLSAGSCEASRACCTGVSLPSCSSDAAAAAAAATAAAVTGTAAEVGTPEAAAAADVLAAAAAAAAVSAGDSMSRCPVNSVALALSGLEVAAAAAAVAAAFEVAAGVAAGMAAVLLLGGPGAAAAACCFWLAAAALVVAVAAPVGPAPEITPAAALR
eukprot:203269-Pelagomonas_calceolata.AAC.2